MIERINRQITIKVPPTGVVQPWSYNLPRTSLLEVSYRIKPINFTFTEGWFNALGLTFGSGSPPDFGLGALQTMRMTLPPQFAPLWEWEESLKRAKEELTHGEEDLTNTRTTLLALQVSLAEAEANIPHAEFNLTNIKTKAEFEEKFEHPGEIPANYALRAEVAQAEIALAEARLAVDEKKAEIVVQERAIAAQERANDALERAIEKIELEKPEGWTPLVTGTFQRSFDALRLTLDASPNAEFVFEETIEAYRPEDIGPTYTRPLEPEGGG